jgi:hypothetical protein
MCGDGPEAPWRLCGKLHDPRRPVWNMTMISAIMVRTEQYCALSPSRTAVHRRSPARGGFVSFAAQHASCRLRKDLLRRTTTLIVGQA